MEDGGNRSVNCARSWSCFASNLHAEGTPANFYKLLRSVVIWNAIFLR